MKTEIITIGNELLNGSTPDTNATWIADQLWCAGIRTERIVTIGDESQEIRDALRQSLDRAQIILVTGGLGPTHDDITKKSVADFFNLPLVENLVLRQKIEERFAKRGIPMPKINLEQAWIPKGSKILPNKIGTAAGFSIQREKKFCFVMPGVPSEMKGMLRDSVLPFLQKKFGNETGNLFSLTIRTTGIYESKLYEILSPVFEKHGEVQIASLPHRFGVDLRLTASGNSRQEAEKKVTNVKDSIVAKIAAYVYEVGNRNLENVVSELLKRRQATLAVAESCTGGLINHLFTNIPGSSDFLLGGVVAYENAVKINLLGVSRKTLEKFGAVSRETALEMAKGVQKATNSNCAISTTGIAGPSGGTEEKPVGLVYIGVAVDDDVQIEKYIFHKERMINKYRFAYAAMNLLRTKLLT
ncbi:MAG TPA: competence/damage-inducible protein A [Bacteroidetes bacterium]|nr:competence/damage-inducible protein A [Bacteroidota bacterium]